MHKASTIVVVWLRFPCISPASGTTKLSPELHVLAYCPIPIVCYKLIC